MKFFSYESKFSQLLLKLCYACYLNLLWFVCSIPIFTIGASTTALYYASLKLVRGEENHIGRQFFHSFKENFKQATVLWLILLGIGLFLGADGYIVYHLRASSTGTAAVLWTLIMALLIAAGVVYVIVLTQIFPLLASFSNTNLAMLKNSFLIGTHYLFATIMVFAVHFAMFFAVVALFTPLIVFGEGLCALISAWMLNHVLISVAGAPEKEEEEQEEETES
jgi:Predicted integral membrane protein